MQPPLLSPECEDRTIPYCLCEGPEYGEMIACDNEDCAIEWFHLGCVGLKTAPKGKWKCPECRCSVVQTAQFSEVERG